MDQHVRHIQRLADGELDQAQATAAQKLAQSDAGLAAEAQQLDALASRFRKRDAGLDTIRSARDEAVMSIMDALPSGAPEHQRHITVGVGIASVAASLLLTVAYLGLAGSMDNLVQLLLLALLSICLGLGGLLLPAFIRPDSDLFGRLFGRRVMLSSDQQFLIRCIGLAIIVGGVIAAGQALIAV